MAALDPLSDTLESVMLFGLVVVVMVEILCLVLSRNYFDHVAYSIHGMRLTFDKRPSKRKQQWGGM